MANHNTYIVTGWPRFFVIWGRVLIGLCLLVILLWLLGNIFGEETEAHVDSSKSQNALVSVPSEDIVHDFASEITSGVVEEKPEQIPEPVKEVIAVPQYEAVTDIAILRVYFDIGSDVVPLTAINDLRPTVDYLIANKSAVAILSGYHDASGNTEINQKISKKRAVALRDFLVTEGVDIDRLILKKPQKSQGSGAPSQARRVEVEVASVINPR